MAKLTSEQRNFLIRHKIELASVFDATGLQKSQYKSAMEAIGKSVAIGVTPCKKGGHTMRSASGHCIQCHPEYIAYRDRYHSQGKIYISGSLSCELIKVGMASDVDIRESGLNSLGYAGANDWEVLCWVKASDAGRVEFDVHRRLEIYSTDSTYIRNGEKVYCREVFRCGYEEAKAAVDACAGSSPESWVNVKRTGLYNFARKRTNNSPLIKAMDNQHSINRNIIISSGVTYNTQYSTQYHNFSKEQTDTKPQIYPEEDGVSLSEVIIDLNIINTPSYEDNNKVVKHEKFPYSHISSTNDTGSLSRPDVFTIIQHALILIISLVMSSIPLLIICAMLYFIFEKLFL